MKALATMTLEELRTELARFRGECPWCGGAKIIANYDGEMRPAKDWRGPIKERPAGGGGVIVHAGEAMRCEHGVHRYHSKALDEPSGGDTSDGDQCVTRQDLADADAYFDARREAHSNALAEPSKSPTSDAGR